MKKRRLNIPILLIEIFVIVLCVYALNTLVVEVLNPDYTKNWQTEEEWIQSESKGVFIDNVAFYRPGIEEKQNTDRMLFLFLFALAVGGYYCAKYASRLFVERKEKLANNEDVIYYNKKITLYRTLALAGIVCFVMCTLIIITLMTIENTDSSGKIVLTRPFGKFPSYAPMLIMMSFLISAVAFGPYFVFRRLTDAFPLKYCFLFTLSYAVVIIVAIALRINPIIAGGIASGLPMFITYQRKMNRVSKELGIRV